MIENWTVAQAHEYLTTFPPGDPTEWLNDIYDAVKAGYIDHATADLRTLAYQVQCGAWKDVAMPLIIRINGLKKSDRWESWGSASYKLN